MPWGPVTVEAQRREFVMLAQQQTMPFQELCRRFGISPRIGCKWCTRFAQAGEAGLQDRSRRPHRTRPELSAELQEVIVALRREHPCWGARKLQKLLARDGWERVPAASAITRVLQRHGLLGAEAPAGQRPWQRFVRAAPNDLWQGRRPSTRSARSGLAPGYHIPPLRG